MAVLLERGDGATIFSTLKLVSPDTTVPPGYTGPVYEIDEDASVAVTEPANTKEIIHLDITDSEDENSDAVLLRPRKRGRPRKRIYMPPEIIHRILEWTQIGYGIRLASMLKTLKNASVVCKEWTDPARRILFEKVKIVNAPQSIQRLRPIFDQFPELGRAVKYLDLSKPSQDWSARTMNEVFRRTAGLIRMTPCVSSISLLHVALTDKIRSRLFNALLSLKPEKATIISSSYSGNGRLRTTAVGGYERRNDMLELGRLLAGWKSLKELEIQGYCSPPRIIDASIFPRHDFPSYQLTRLDLVSVSLPDTSLLGLVGTDPSCLKTLKLCTVTGITNDSLEEVFKHVGPSLETFHLSIDSEEDDIDDFFEPSILLALAKLQHLTLATDLFPETVLGAAVSLPEIRIVCITLPNYTFATAMASLTKPSYSLQHVLLETWDSPETFWEPAQRWEFAKYASSLEIEFSLNGSDFDEIQDEWWGIDLSKDWDILERVASRRSGRTSRRCRRG